jgi:dCTP deaminase
VSTSEAGVSRRWREAGAPATGILPYQALRELVRAGEISARRAIEAEQLQPASLDLRLGRVAYRIRASFLPGPDTPVLEKLARYGMHEIDLGGGGVLEKGCVYMVPLQERVRLASRLTALANPKSSIGRLDVFTRLITDDASAFDRVPASYDGPLYAEIAPRTFSIQVREGSRLCQLRVRRGTPTVRTGALKRLNEDVRLVDTPPEHAVVRDGLIGVTLDLDRDPGCGVVGFRARKHADVVDVDRVAAYDPADFWEPLAPHKGGGIVLDPDDFHILSTAERVRVPPDHAAEMVAYDTMVGEFRVHYAGFFDPGFGWGEGAGSKAVLEVRSHDVPFVLEHGQTIGWLRFERLAGTPDRLYGADVGSSYQGQGLRLGKQFRPWR